VSLLTNNFGGLRHSPLFCCACGTAEVVRFQSGEPLRAAGVGQSWRDKAVIPIPDPGGVESPAMNISAFILVLSAILASGLFAQTNARPTTQQPYEIQISSGVAEELLVSKADVVCPRMAMPPRITGTVVVGIEIDRNGNVLHSKVISGPAMLRKPVLDSVRKYKYKPYLLNGKAVDVETTVLVTMDSYLDCHYS
jgi:hypothetical protein